MSREYDYKDMVEFYLGAERAAARREACYVADLMSVDGLPTDDSYGTVDYPELR